MVLNLILSVLVLFAIRAPASQPSPSDILFEGRYQIVETMKKSDGQIQSDHIGFIFNRYSFDKKNKQFQMVQVVRTVNPLGQENTESLNATVDESFRPITFEYANSLGKETRSLSAIVAGNKMRTVVRYQGAMTTESIELPPKIFLGEFLIFMMMKNKDGLQARKSFVFDAISSRDGKIYRGESLVGGVVEVGKGLKASLVTTHYRGLTTLSKVTDSGKILTTEQSGLEGTKGQQVIMVDSDLSAIGNLNVPQELLVKIFGSRFMNQKWLQGIKGRHSDSRSAGSESSLGGLTNKTSIKPQYPVGGPEIDQSTHIQRKRKANHE